MTAYFFIITATNKQQACYANSLDEAHAKMRDLGYSRQEYWLLYAITAR